MTRDSHIQTGWRSQRSDQIMLLSAAAFRCKREQGSETLLFHAFL